MIRIVVDTNVVVSGLIVPFGNESFVLGGISSSLFTPCYSEEILEEYEEVLGRAKFGFEPEVISGFLDCLKRRGKFFSPDLPLQGLPDPSDEIFLACALAADAQYLVTGNKKHFPESHYGKASVVNAKEFINLIALGPLD